MTATTAKVWDYGEQGRKYPVEPGQVWQVAGHTFVCSDLMASRALDAALSAGPRPTLLYSDPPWNQGNLNSFRTKARLPKASHTILELFVRIRMIADEYRLPLYVEGSKIEMKEGAAIVDAIHRGQGTKSAYWPITYYHRSPCGLYYSGYSPTPVESSTVSGKDDDDTPGIVMRAHGSTGVVVDPCSGLGQTPLEAARNGWSSITNEMHPNRMSAAMVRVGEVLGASAVRVK